VVADQGLGVPASNADAFRSLSDAGLLDPDLATALAGAVEASATSWSTTTSRSTTPR
jgi:uncharacterized protein YutE (UPF0331/DUF86 family)